MRMVRGWQHVFHHEFVNIQRSVDHLIDARIKLFAKTWYLKTNLTLIKRLHILTIIIKFLKIPLPLVSRCQSTIRLKMVTIVSSENRSTVIVLKCRKNRFDNELLLPSGGRMAPIKNISINFNWVNSFVSYHVPWSKSWRSSSTGGWQPTLSARGNVFKPTRKGYTRR